MLPGLLSSSQGQSNSTAAPPLPSLGASKALPASTGRDLQASGHGEQAKQQHQKYPSKAQTSSVGGGSSHSSQDGLQEGATVAPCRARGMPKNHNARVSIAYEFVINSILVVLNGTLRRYSMLSLS